MKLIKGVLRTASNIGFSRRAQSSLVLRNFSSGPFSGSRDNEGTNFSESNDDFEGRIFGDDHGTGSDSSSFFRNLDKIKKAHDRPWLSPDFSFGNKSDMADGLDESFDTLTDGMDGKLKQAAAYFDYDSEEIENEDYSFRPDVNFALGMTYEPKDLDLTKPGVQKPFKRDEFETTTEEVLRKADFRNVRFLANFITEAGIIIKRSKTGISAKAQRKVAREIKTARAFGLMPFTTMGTKQFVYGKTMEALDADYQYETYETGNFADIEES